MRARIGWLTRSSDRSGHPSGTESYAQLGDSKLIDIIRLNLNHLLMKEVAGYLINPKIPTFDEHIRVADVGTGTA